MTYYLQHRVFLVSCYQLSNEFRECVLQRYIISDKTMAQQLNATRVLVVQRKIFINKTKYEKQN